MAERWSDDFAARVREWCEKVAALGADMLVRSDIVPLEEFDRASSIVAEELFVRLALLDFPPMPKVPDFEQVVGSDNGESL